MMASKTKPKPGSFAFGNAGLSEDQAQNIWQALKKAIEEIQNGNASQLRFEELYRNAYTLVLHKYGDLLYKGVSECVSRRLQSTSKTVTTASNEALLETMVAQWDHHKLMMGMIRDILMYMDKTYCKLQKKTPIYDMGLLLFRDHIVRSNQVNQRLKTILLANVYRERTGEVIDHQLMKKCLSMLVEVGVYGPEVYQSEFEKDFLSETRNFYQTEAQDFIAQNTVPDYLRKVESRLAQEDRRADAYLDRSTRPKLRVVVQEELIRKFAKRLVSDEKTGAVPMMTQGAIEDLSRMYTIFACETGMLDHVREAMSSLVKETGTNIVQDKENVKNPTMFVQQVLDARAKFHAIVTQAFKQDRLFVRSLKEALEYFINLDTRAAQYLSLYLDDMLRSGIKALAEHEIETKLNNVISIFRYLQDKDVFEDFYKQHLAARLLTGTSVNAEVEKIMISKLKTECGHQFTSRLEGMFKDMDLSKTLMVAYKEWETKHNSSSQTELAVNVLTTGFWPVPTVQDCVLPKEAQTAVEHFTAFYTHVHSGRRLAWQTSMGNAEIRASFDKGRRHELVVHTYQMCILMLFNSKTSYTLAEIEKLTKIPSSELGRHLLSLAHPKVRLLKKSPNNRTLAPEHAFSFNSDYDNQLFRVKVPLMSKNEAPAVNAATESASLPPGVLEARKNRVEAAIVRVMKSRKVLEHSNLIAEVLKQLSARFAVEPSFIKKRIEVLIEREYLERDKDDRRKYHYLA